MGGLLHRLDDAWIGTTAADVAIHAGPDLRLAGTGQLVKQGGGAHDHAAGAIGTLECADIEECLLYGRKLSILLKAFDGCDLLANGICNQRLTGVDGLPVQQHRACAALSFAAAVLGAGEVETIAQDGEKGLVGGRADFHRCAVYVQNKITHIELQAGAHNPTKAQRGRALEGAAQKDTPIPCQVAQLACSESFCVNYLLLVALRLDGRG